MKADFLRCDQRRPLSDKCARGHWARLRRVLSWGDLLRPCRALRLLLCAGGILRWSDV